MKYLLAASALLSSAAAFPAMYEPALAKFAEKYTAETLVKRSGLSPQAVSAAETNCGPVPCLVFNAKEQYVSTSGVNQYVKPTTGDIRGPCPGLNAAANHGYLPRNGIATIEETIAGLGQAYGMSIDLAAFLAAYAIALDGNIVQMVWSIGGPLPPQYLLDNLLGTGQGISYSHNNYEGDSSIGRNDIYPSGDAYSLNVTKFQLVYDVGGSEDRYTMDKFRQRFEAVQDGSIANNPYYFTGFFSTVLVVPAAYNFVINFMSNHTAHEPSGYLNGEIFKTFFGITGKSGEFVWHPGQEKIPENWYRRTSSNQYNAADVLVDLGIGYLAYPTSLKIGGNTGTVNSFTGVNIANLTGGAYDIKTLFKGDNFQCFAFLLVQQAIPDFLKGPLSALNSAQSFLSKYTKPIFGKLNCPELSTYDQGLFNSFPGRNYEPKGPNTSGG